jgi:monofunctional biosynthetic peptidoglycan transglycosylase
VLSLENNGGFAQIYSPTETADFSDYSAVRLRIKGDGRRYQFRMATDARFRGSRIAYRAEFATEADEWMEVALPFSSFQPSHHGRMLSGPPLDLTSVREIAFLLADGQAGPFALKMEWIGLE